MLITRGEDLATFMDRVREHGAMALDMEFEREHTYWPKLQLIQIAVPESAVAVDPLALTDLAPLFEVVADPRITKVMHSGRQDAEIVFIRTGRPPAAVFDTQIAAALLGMGEQIGYGALVQRLLGARIRKAERVTDWGRRPLSTAQMEYALDDVRHLLEIHRLLREQLEARGRTEWLHEELSIFEDPATFSVDPARSYLRISGHRTLDARELAVLREIARWREEEASTRDVPRSRVVPDDVMIEIARRKPRRPEDLEPLRRFQPRERERSGRVIVEAVARGLAAPAGELPVVLRPEREDPDQALVADFMTVLLRKRAREGAVAPSYLGTQGDLQDLVSWLAGKRSEAPPHLAAGWRREIVGEDLIRLWDGKIALQVVRGRLEEREGS